MPRCYEGKQTQYWGDLVDNCCIKIIILIKKTLTLTVGGEICPVLACHGGFPHAAGQLRSDNAVNEAPPSQLGSGGVKGRLRHRGRAFSDTARSGGLAGSDHPQAAPPPLGTASRLFPLTKLPR